jgi:hypothetical protein
MVGQKKKRNLLCFPRIADPEIREGDSGNVVVRLDHVPGQRASLGLVLVVQDKDGKASLLRSTTKLLSSNIHVLLQLAHGVLESGACVVDLVDNENVLANQVGHLERRQIQPLCAGDLCAGDLFGRVGAQCLVQRETDGLDGDVGAAGSLEEGAEDASGHVATAANGNDQVGFALAQDLLGRVLAELVYLRGPLVSKTRQASALLGGLCTSLYVT